MKLSLIYLITAIISQTTATLSDEVTRYPMTSSTWCIEGCVDNQHNFCSSEEGNSGTCCAVDDAECPRPTICSNDVSSNSLDLKYFACPHNNAICGGRSTQTALKSVSELYFPWVSESDEDLLEGILCRFKLQFPETATDEL